MISSPPSLDFDTQRSFAALSQHILKLEQEIENLKHSPNASSSSRETSSSPAASTSVEEPPSTDLGNSSLIDSDVQLSSQLKKMTISSNHARHFGFSSTMSLLGVALQVGKEKNKVPNLDDTRHFRQPQFWTVHPWEYVPEEDEVVYSFPDPDLLSELVDLYFEHVNALFPLLHRPTFEKGLREGLHFTDTPFGSTVLAVCAVASRYTDNHAVLLEGNDSRYAAGWKWFSQIRQCWRTSARTVLLQDIQTICVRFSAIALAL
ncbi:hypothetical protein H0H87_005166 [Tephrocybe sp. NHM501043]|nr:hypothetical protein H0H87_005166 [Tephrocybe sp. NHM501043]